MITHQWETFGLIYDIREVSAALSNQFCNQNYTK